MPNLSIADLAEALRQLPLLSPEQVAEVARRQKDFAGATALAEELVRCGWLTAFQAKALLGGRGQELVLGSYLLLEPRGEGGMGKVFKAYHRVMKRTVALKIIRRDLLADPRGVERFHREIQAVAKLSHPNIVVAHDAAEVGDIHFLVMEYLEGIDLERLARSRGPLPVAEACEYVRQAALGLQHVEAHGMVHRDLKPSNLLLTSVLDVERQSPRPVVKILDLGLVLSLAPSDQTPPGDELTASHLPLGTPAYAAPEQVLDPHAVDIRADIFSLGCTLYYLLTGQVAYPRSGDRAAGWLRHQFYTPPPVEQLRAEVPPALAALIHRMMAKDPRHRCQTSAEVVASLAPFCQGGTSLEWAGELLSALPADQTPTAPYYPPARDPDRPRTEAAAGSAATSILPSEGSRESMPAAVRKASRRRGLWIGAGAALALLGAGLVFVNLPEPSPQPAGPPPPAPKVPTAGKKPTEPPPPQPKFPVGELACFEEHTDWVSCASFFPDGSQIVSGGADGLRVWDAQTGAAKPIFFAGQPRGVKSLVVCPQGRFVVVGGQNKGEYLDVWEVATHQRKNLPARHTEPVACVAVSGDGARALSFGYDKKVWLWDLEAGNSLGPFDTFEEFPLAIAFLPGDRQFLTAGWKPAGGNQSVLVVRKVNTADAKDFQQFNSLVPQLKCAAISPKGDRLLLGDLWGIVHVYDLKTNQILNRLEGHVSPIHSLVISPDGSRALSGAGELQNFKPVDCTVRLWDLTTGKELHSFKGHTRPIWGLAFTPDGLRAVSTSQDRTARVWGLPLAK